MNEVAGVDVEVGAAGSRAVVPGVIVTREEGPEGRLRTLLGERGFDVISWPTIRIAPPANPGALDAALEDLRDYGWIVFTSPRAVNAVATRIGSGSDRMAVAERPRVAAVGDSTARTLRGSGWPVDLVPETQTGRALVEAMRAHGVRPGTWVLFPASAIAGNTVPEGLEDAGLVVVQVEAYRTERARLDREACAAVLDQGRAGVVTFTSPSTVRNLEAALGDDLTAVARKRLRAVAIGPTTGAEAEARGWNTVVADLHSLEGLAERVAEVAGPGSHRGERG